MSLITWSWIFLILYAGGMLAFGAVASRRVRGADDFATARRGYGPGFLAFAFAATTASGGTFIGLPGLAHDLGLSAMWIAVLYPAGVYLGMWLCSRMLQRAGNMYGSRSIPEFLGDRYGSDAIRVLVALFSLLLCFYLAAQLVSGLIMFELMLGLSPVWALTITSLVLLIYVALGGAHADILTDGVQGAVMAAFALLVIILFVSGMGLDAGIVETLAAQDEALVATLHPTSPLTRSWWSLVAVFLAHLPLGLLPHIGNKLWALGNDNDRLRFVALASIVGLMLGMLGLGGLHARALLGDALQAAGQTGNYALPSLFIELFPPWLAALVGVGILAALMSTADGLVVSTSQIAANDLYRCTIAPRRHAHWDDARVDAMTLRIGRFGTVVVMLVCTAMAWALIEHNVAMLIWIGVGGMMAAFSGPLILGAVWRGVTRAGAFAGLIGGAITFAVLHAGLLDPAWLSPGAARDVIAWLEGEAPNPYSCAAFGEAVSVLFTWAVSRRTAQLDDAHLQRAFG